MFDILVGCNEIIYFSFPTANKIYTIYRKESEISLKIRLGIHKQHY